jgi:hypothetical protein
VTETTFLVDAYKHRIVKRDGTWKLYCPERSGDSLILANTFKLIRIALTEYPCKHGWIVPKSHGVEYDPKKGGLNKCQSTGSSGSPTRWR